MFSYNPSIVITSILLSISSLCFAQDWTLERDRSGVKIYTRFVKGWDLKQFKGIVNIRTDIKTVENTLRDDEGRNKWMYNTFDSKDIKKVSEVFNWKPKQKIVVTK